MRSASLALVAALITATGCKGSIEGNVFGTDGADAYRLTSHPVFLLTASNDVASALKAACPGNDAGWSDRARAERARFDQIATTYSDSARDEFALRRGSRRWTALIRTMNVYRDSASSMDGRPPLFPRELVEKLAMNRANTGANGQYVFADLSPGTYLVATELRDEYRWVPVQVARKKAIADVTPRGSKTSCDVARGL
jgi:hypothetical protein